MTQSPPPPRLGNFIKLCPTRSLGIQEAYILEIVTFPCLFKQAQLGNYTASETKQGQKRKNSSLSAVSCNGALRPLRSRANEKSGRSFFYLVLIHRKGEFSERQQFRRFVIRFCCRGCDLNFFSMFTYPVCLVVCIPTQL